MKKHKPFERFFPHLNALDLPTRQRVDYVEGGSLFEKAYWQRFYAPFLTAYVITSA